MTSTLCPCGKCPRDLCPAGARIIAQRQALWSRPFGAIPGTRPNKKRGQTRRSEGRGNE